ncbi:MAG: 5-methyltetrahydropteroyltriglutamate--homocysteine S-methyltransferase [Parvibaculaceae bacterium]
MSIATANLGFPRIGPRRELKSALESFWSGKSGKGDLLAVAKALRKANWELQKKHGIDHIPSNDFSLYDHVLDVSAMVGAVPAVYGWHGGPVSIETYFAMARGSQAHAATESCAHGQGPSAGMPALEMTKWFDTNYHFMVPELASGQDFELASTKPVDEFLEAKALGIHTRPVLVGPVTYLLLAKAKDGAGSPLTLLSGLLPVYAEILRRLRAAGADWVQMDEPALVLDLSAPARAAFRTAYEALARDVPDLKLMLTTYFGALGDNAGLALDLPVAGLHVDLCAAPEQGETILRDVRSDLIFSLGLVSGRNIWRNDLTRSLTRIERYAGRNGIVLAPSSSLLHVPVDLALERDLDPEIRNWLAFATQKIEETALLARGLREGRVAIAAALALSDEAAEERKSSARIHDKVAQLRARNVTHEMTLRLNPFNRRRRVQAAKLGLPAFPTTTIGSFPQTADVRKARAAHAKGEMSAEAYDAFLRKETEAAVRWQEEIGIDVLVHGEFERNDMVQYFGEQLRGFTFTRHGWVQSYGSRYVRPPVIFGDVSRPKPMTVAWSAYAQSLTERPLKGMLTGPVTILQWSFVRDDLARSDVCRQIALAIRDEVLDLEDAGIGIIQIDEPAIREGLPLRRADWKGYLGWAVECFRLAASGVRDETQIHTHMCYCEFNDIIEAIGSMDADVISIETSRSKMELLDAFVSYRYPNEIGPGVYDIHSPRVPEADEMVGLLIKARSHLSPDQIWVNPDCGLKTRKWEEVRPALVNMVAAARKLRGGIDTAAVE